jgi:hypothetical protein
VSAATVVAGGAGIVVMLGLAAACIYLAVQVEDFLARLALGLMALAAALMILALVLAGTGR